MTNLKTITLKEIPIRPRPVLTYRDIIGLFTEMFDNFSEDIFKSKSRKREYVYVRFIAMWYMERHLKLGLKYIGGHFADKDHSSVIHARTKVNEAAEKAGRNPTLHLWHSKFSEYAIPPHIDQLLRKKELQVSIGPIKDGMIDVSDLKHFINKESVCFVYDPLSQKEVRVTFNGMIEVWQNGKRVAEFQKPFMAVSYFNAL